MTSGDGYLGPRANFIDGEWAGPPDRTIDVLDPATNEAIATVPASSYDEVDRAVRSARASFERGEWSNATPSERGRLLWALASLVRAHGHDLAVLETRDSGKPIREAREDVAAVADIFEYYAGIATKIVGQTLPLPGGQFGIVVREPMGVVGAITPWNFPVYLAAWKAAPALAAGNTVVLKPSSLTSLTTLELARLATEAGIPAGTLNVVCGSGAEAGVALAEHDDVDMLAFTGSTEVGALVMAARARRVRPVQVELGGKSPNVVFADADLDRAVAGAAFGIFFAQGENCNAGSRILVEARIHDQFVEALVEKARQLRVRSPLDEEADLGAIVSRPQLDRIDRYVAIGLSEGATAATGAHVLSGDPFGRGNFYAPTVLRGVEPGARVFREEIFGPVVTVTPFTGDAEAVRLANATDYGLAAGVWTSNVDRAFAFARKVASGYVWINTFNTTPVEAPFGGVKSSGFGRDCGPQALDNYLTWKTIALATTPFEDWYPASTTDAGPA